MFVGAIVPRRADLGALEDAFSDEDFARLRQATQAIRTSYLDFIVFATRQALDEMEGIAADQDRIDRYYDHIFGRDYGRE